MVRSSYRKHLLTLVGALALALGLAAWGTVSAEAHTRIEAGPYIIVVGWEEEPVIVGERNAVWLEILEGDVPISEDVKVDLEASVVYGGHSFLGFPAPAEQPGIFLMDIFPTIRGTYELQLTGTIGNTPVDTVVELDEVQPGSALQFPEAQPDSIAMQADLEAMQAELLTAKLLAVAGLAVGVFGLGLAVFSLIRRTKS